MTALDARAGQRAPGAYLEWDSVETIAKVLNRTTLAVVPVVNPMGLTTEAESRSLSLV